MADSLAGSVKQSSNGNGTPRRAGVSAFGVGGTNAHVVLEEAPELPPAAEDGRPQLLVLSAKGEGALGRELLSRGVAPREDVVAQELSRGAVDALGEPAPPGEPG